MLSATTFQQLYAVQHTQQYLQLSSSYQPPPDTGCLPCKLPQPNRRDLISVWFRPQQPKVSTPTCWDATNCRVPSLLPPAQQLTDWQQLHQVGMPLLEDSTPTMHEREIQVLVDENKAPSETTKDEHRLEHEELVFEKDVYLCAFVGDVVEHALPKGLKANSFDGKIDSYISDDTNKQSKKAKEFFSTMDVLKILHQL
ncbi:hypothetical protein SASPL_135415 [Salvia splendens]|uniref:Uncharacterized protein n=1 Tax=Salvia splendens TaxID=180675 RepID=A0A8X8ZFY4_SALSN|nr:hypothetical protein SASPL_135415 [Salvia splendens]